MKVDHLLLTICCLAHLPLQRMNPPPLVSSNITVNVDDIVIISIIGIDVNNFEQAEMLERSLPHEEKGKIYISESSLGDGESIIGDCGYVGREIRSHNSI